jgi:hypothetical protein
MSSLSGAVKSTHAAVKYVLENKTTNLSPIIVHFLYDKFFSSTPFKSHHNSMATKRTRKTFDSPGKI